jgi:mannan endo-1,4-beta-mannosidase
MAQREFAGASGANLTLNDRPFYFAGANNYYLIYKSEFMINSVLDAALAIGLKAVRTWAFLDRGSLDGSVPDVDPPGDKEGVFFHYWDPARGAPAFNDGPDGLQRLDFVVHAAGQRGLKLILPLVNNWNQFGGIDQYVTWYRLNSHDEFYTNPDARDAYKNWALHILNRRNIYSGVLYKDDPTILAWELANEPRWQGSIERLNSGSCNPERLIGWVGEMSAFLKQNDSKHLVAVGDEGFFRRSAGSDWLRNGSQGVDFDAFLRTPSIDFGTLHLYADNWGKDIAWGTRWIEEHISAGVEAGKPVLLEEYGWREQATRDEAFGTWLNTVEREGGAADLVWMLAGLQDDGSLFPDYDHYTIYVAGASAVTAHAAVMEAKSRPAV